jgi:uncharacterized glyoxalase superfamily protein PhnB
MPDVYPLRGVNLVVSVPDRESVDRLHAELRAAGHASPQDPFDAFFGSRYAVVEDPGRNPVA